MNKQNRRTFISNTAMAGAGIITAAASHQPKDQKIIHHVFFWLKDPSSTKDKERLMEGLKTLKAIKSIKQFYIGTPASTEQRSVVDSSYHVSELMFFNDLEGQKTYQDHPIHKKFVEDCSHLWEKVVVYDMLAV